MVEIREMRYEDLEDVISIIRAHLEVDGRLARDYYEKYFADPKRVQSTREVSYVAKGEDRIVGVAGHYPDKYDWPSILWLNWFYVHPEWRRRGVGSTLLTYVIDLVRKHGMRKLYLDTSSDESYNAAVQLYRRFGFQQEGLLLDYYGTGDHYLIMGLTL